MTPLVLILMAQAELMSFSFEAAGDHTVDHHKFGFELGSRFSDGIHSRFAAKATAIDKLLALAGKAPALYDGFVNLHTAVYPRYMAELQGVAAGSGVDFKRLFLQNIVEEFSLCAGEGSTRRVADHCSDFARCALADSCALAHNEDSSYEDRNATVLAAVRFGGQPAFTAYTYLGELPSGAFGYNDAGVGFTLNWVGPTQPQCPGLARGFFSRALLEQTSIDTAITAITDPRGGGGHNYQLVWFGAAPPRVVSVEVAPGGEYAVRPTSTTAYFHANQYTALNVPQSISNSSSHRMARANLLLPAINAALPSESPAAMVSALGGQHDRHWPIYHDDASHRSGDLSDWTVASALFNLTRRNHYTLTVFHGNPRHGQVVARRALLTTSAPPPASPLTCEAGPTTLTVHYAATSATLAAADLHYIAVASPHRPSHPLGLMTTSLFPAALDGLRPNTTYTISVYSHPTTLPTIAWGPSWKQQAAAINCTTTTAPTAHSSAADVTVRAVAAAPAATAGASPVLTANANTAATLPGSHYLRVYRISEYAFSPDFLSNHNGVYVCICVCMHICL